MIWDTVLNLAGKVIDKAFPDPIEKQKAQLALLQLHADEFAAQLKAETDILTKQIEVNAVEAASSDPFVRRGRPFVIWTGGVALAYQSIGQSVLGWLSGINGWPMPPTIDNTTLGYIMASLLGVAGMRSYDKQTANK